MRPRLQSLRSLAGACLALVASPSLALPEIQDWTHESGAPVYFVAAPELAIVDVAISFAAGSARDGERHGLASLVAKLLDDGSGGKDADAIAEEFARHAASFSVTVDLDRMVVKLRSLSEARHLRPALEQVASILREPDFPQQALEREAARARAQLRAKQQSPGTLASERLYAAMYGSHPYAFPTSGTEETVSGIGREHLRQFHQRYLAAANASVAVVGKLDRDEAEEMARMLLEGLPRGQRADPVKVDAAGGNDATSEAHPFPSAQRHILLGHPSIAIDNPDRIALYVGNRILGSGMVSRLFRSIREQHGLAYSVYSYFLPLQSAGPFIVGMQTEASQAERSVRLLRRQLREYLEEGPTEDELSDVKDYIAGTFADRYSSNAKLASYLSWMAFYGLPPDYLRDFLPKVRAVSAEQVRRAFERHLRMDELHEVQLGGEP